MAMAMENTPENEGGRWIDLDKLLSRPGNIVSPGFEPSPQLREEIGELAKVLVVGAGGLGCELLKDLALSSFKNIDVIDMDTIEERSCMLLRFADLLEKHSDKIAALETWDNGKPYEQAFLVEIPLVVRLIRYYAGWADKIHGLVVPADGPHHVQVMYEPIGVADLIIPWNFPLLIFAWKVGPALACGNTVVLKTAEQTPLSALYDAKLLHETIKTNVIGTLNMLGLAKRVGAR